MFIKKIVVSVIILSDRVSYFLIMLFFSFINNYFFACSYDTKGSYQMQIICTQFYGFKYSYKIQIIYTQLYGFKQHPI